MTSDQHDRPVGGAVPGAPAPRTAAPEQRSPTGCPFHLPGADDVDPRAQAGDHLTTAQGLRVDDTDHSLKAGRRGPLLMEDHHFREKMTHFDHERIPERVVHARGAGAHGTFRAYGNASSVTKAGFLSEADKETPVFVRFSTVLGSRGSADTARDVRGFATKFYTDEGTFDLVGNNIPVFFIQDAIKFPDIIHAGKPHPDREIPQAQSAHDTFWDFISSHTESTHMAMWTMSDRAIPRSYRTMEGFGVHTFRLEAADGSTALVKFHWKPVLGVHSLVWEEAQIAQGADPDFHRRDLADAIDLGAFPQWELGLQIMPDTPDETFEGIDLLDPTKIVPEELCPVQPVGIMTLTANPTNYFAETEQIAFHVDHLVPGIQVTNDPLMQGRLFSYLDTQLSRLGGPNFAQLPINRPHAPVNDMLRDGIHQTAVHSGVVTYKPNAIDGDRPVTRPEAAYVTLPTPVEGEKVRANPVSFEDHFTQARLFWLSLSPVEQAHEVEAFTFELGKCASEEIRARMLASLAKVDGGLASRVADGLGLDAPSGDVPDGVQPSPALSQLPTEPGRIDGRVVGVLVHDGADLGVVGTLRAALDEEGVVVRVVAAHGGEVASGRTTEVVDRTILTTRSIEYDAVVVADGTTGTPIGTDPRTAVLLQEAFRHGKAIAAVGDGADVLAAAGVDTSAPDVTVTGDATTLPATLRTALGLHRSWDRLAQLGAV
ncbi:catalase [Cellulosimicrobium marinum]|uniref:catalase n=1 Tax=Cellulosimicrobium marinum TaxID=1638992 RepID=UPI001E4448A2|nr:catalase [Cellulosimicrobium marinum]MCB7135538.1 catalase [Cellulosimicrobium marinum]